MGFVVFHEGEPRAYEPGSGAPPRAVEARTVGEVMSQPVVTVHPDLRVAGARSLFREHGFRHLPVMTISGSLAGMISDRDVLSAESVEPDRWVLHLMTRDVLTVTQGTPVRDVARVMAAEQVNAVPVIDDAHKIVGIVTTTDLLRCLV